MAGLISPQPISYSQQQHNLQYNPYARSGMLGYETPPLPTAPLAHPVPHQPVGQFIVNHNVNTTLAVNANGNLGEDSKIYNLVIHLMDPTEREVALLDLSKKREQYDDLALVLWHSFGEILVENLTRK